MKPTFTPGPWSQGRLLDTAQTRKMDIAKKAENRFIESRLVFSSFSEVDQGKSRTLVGVFEKPEDAALCAAAPDMLSALTQAHEALVHSAPKSNNPSSIDRHTRALDYVAAAIASAVGDK